MTGEKEQSSGWEKVTTSEALLTSVAEQAAGLPGATPVFMIFKGGWHACTHNHKTLIVAETYG